MNATIQSLESHSNRFVAARRRWSYLSLLLITPGLAGGQAAPGGGRRLEVTSGVIATTQRDENASPVRYGGVGSMFEIGYGARPGPVRWGVRLGAAFSSLTSFLTRSDAPREQAMRGWIEGEYLRSPGSAARRTRWLIGGRLRATVSVTEHIYADPNGDDLRFAYLTAGAGPVLGVERGAPGRMTLSGQVGVPLFVLVARPYSDVRLVPVGGLPLRLTTAFDAPAADFGLTFRSTLGRRADLVAGYRLNVQGDDTGRPYRSASQAVSITLAIRMGGRS